MQWYPGDEGTPVRELAAVVGKHLNIPVVSMLPEKAAEHFEWMGSFIAFDNPATCVITKEQLGWQPTHIGLAEDGTALLLKPALHHINENTMKHQFHGIFMYTYLLPVKNTIKATKTTLCTGTLPCSFAANKN